MTREKYNLRLTVDLDEDTTMGDIRAFVEMSKGVPDDVTVVYYEGLNSDRLILHSFLDPDERNA